MSSTNTADFSPEASYLESPILPVIATFTGHQRWDIFHRLKELGIPCECAGNQPLTVEVNSPTAAAQLWSIQKRLSRSRQGAIAFLKSVWQQPSHIKKAD